MSGEKCYDVTMFQNEAATTRVSNHELHEQTGSAELVQPTKISIKNILKRKLTDRTRIRCQTFWH